MEPKKHGRYCDRGVGSFWFVPTATTRPVRNIVVSLALRFAILLISSCRKVALLCHRQRRPFGQLTAAGRFFSEDP